MISSILIALSGGVAVGMSRSINGRLTMDRGAFCASFWNHFIGFLLLTVFVFIFARQGLALLVDVPGWAFTGGIIGAIFVAISSYVFPRIGANRSALLIIGGQMIAGLLIDHLRGTAQFHIGQPAGVALILSGIYLTRYSR
ncbi:MULTISPECIES: DMT family transporter [Alphaproteobacteria]|uniref:Membrane protein n=2 Tax=Alphaproteobacteria TaxID=28211 RepID=A0A512HES3_9HYPH|nr:MULTISPECIES: DMT family transporter [Alphaproteobacteria]GEO83949.1 membrane protein [Ciceribacter naphthalenivorans]GLR21173.1 membrane protein [Ciceribacter naphthalenivorans]GLT04029.1 membrane protein [Sphingomonas psychrolutea]